MRAILWLDEPGCDDPALVGGKASGLGRWTAHHQVPPGFCVTAEALAHFPEIAAEPFPEALRGLVADAYAALGARCGTPEPNVAVRSSAVDEDGAGASFAGIYTTFLNVRGLDAILDAIARCHAAAADPRVAAYRTQRGLTGAGIAVLVQQLIPADTAAVVFSANPTSGATDEIVINASFGLGESIVGGSTTPDTWILRKPDLSLLRAHTGEKQNMTVLCEGGTREVPVPRTLRTRPSLDEPLVQQLAQLALRLEEAAGKPVDIECAYRDGQLYLLQCRPITTLRAEGQRPRS
ncbi:PEP/pyruvate-binding domain-containing protein [Chondromyces crocatus]|uniref:Phosphoenolpyruvate synthase n=1 Tax=Chondromyces crocatus TaxID=52 RepID=Q0VZ67_CHOCO|nr:PEP/pyruvate-binding domain-containing protein [Chondromyces crocatus]AKT40592.1 uncharacterized protein CMC5_047480 [Chondromyces crocatus]CAJ46695.1 putative phosphoenol pyruvate synthase [Chondromyces crocatus]